MSEVVPGHGQHQGAGPEEAALRSWVRVGLGDETARAKAIEANLPLAAFFARSYAGRGVEVEDLVQEGAIGLIRAVERFEVIRHVPFGSFAYYDITSAIRKAIRAHAKGGEVAAEGEHGEVAAEGDGPEEVALAQVALEELRQAVAGLAEEVRAVLTLRYGLDGGGRRGLNVTARLLHCSSRKVVALEREGLRALSAALREDG
jgi:RNA polymerase sigma factor (sigma-70 family)